MKLTLTDEDIEHCKATWEDLYKRDCAGCTDCDDPESADCFNSETVMTSIGYAEVYADGEVVVYGQVLFTVSEES